MQRRKSYAISRAVLRVGAAFFCRKALKLQPAILPYITGVAANITLFYLLHISIILSLDAPPVMVGCLVATSLFTLFIMLGLDEEDLLVLALIPVVFLLSVKDKMKAKKDDRRDK